LTRKHSLTQITGRSIEFEFLSPYGSGCPSYVTNSLSYQTWFMFYDITWRRSAPENCGLEIGERSKIIVCSGC